MLFLSKLEESLSNLEIKQKARSYIGCSAIGHPCDRKIWLDYQNNEDMSISSTLYMIFELGHKGEEVLIKLLKQLPDECTVDAGQQEVEEAGLKGHIDGIISCPNGYKELLEIKTMNARRFGEIQKKGAYKTNFQYWCQCQVYMGMLGLETAVLVVINKNDCTRYWERIYFDAFLFKRLLKKASYLAETKEMPKGLTVIGKPSFECKYCRYADECFKDQEI